MSQIIVCLKKYAKDSRMVYYFRSMHTLTANIAELRQWKFKTLDRHVIHVLRPNSPTYTMP